MTAAEIVEKFNKQFPVRSRIRWSPHKSGNFREYTVSLKAADHNGTPVVWFAERSGMARIEPDFVDY